MRVCLGFAITMCTVVLSACGTYHEKNEIIENNPNLLGVDGSNETGYRFKFKNGLVCNKPADYTKHIKTKGALAIKSLFEASGDFESKWDTAAQADPKMVDLKAAFFDVCFEYGNELIDKKTYTERSEKYDRIRQKMLGQGLSQDPDRDIRFEARLASAEFFQLNGKRKGQFLLKFEPLMSDPAKAVTVFQGITILHDEDKVDDKVDTQDMLCSEVASCLTYQYWDLARDPVLVRGGPASNGSDFTWVTEFPDNVKHVRIYWQFIQLEGDISNKCSVAAKNLKGGIPLLQMVSSSGQKVEGGCYYSSGRKILTVNLG